MNYHLPTNHQKRYALITPVHNEQSYIGAMIESVLAQTISPAKWIIVDDGSTDGTADIVCSYAARFNVIELLRLPARPERRAGGEGAIGRAVRRLDLPLFDYIARFDADLSFECDYMAQILGEFESDEKLGIAGGGLYVGEGGARRLEKAPDYHVRGAVKTYRRECFVDIGGLGTQIGWDTADEVSAWIKGWKTKSFFQYKVIHCRPTGKGVDARHLQRERGKAEYLTWSSPIFVAGKAIKIGLVNLSLAQPLSYLAGFLSCYSRSEERLPDPKFVRMRRKQQARRLLGKLGLGRRGLDGVV